MDRATREVKIGEHNLKLNTYLTYGERIEINALGLNKPVLDDDGNPVLDPKTGQSKLEVDRSKFGEYQKMLIKYLVVEIDGKKEGVYEAVMNTNESELTGLINELAKAATPLVEKKKEK